MSTPTLSQVTHDDQSTSSNYIRKVWHVADGLPEDTVQALTEAPDGNLWIGTTGGLASFDGARIRPFRPAISLSLGVNSIFTLLSERDGSLWVGTEGGGLLHVKGSAEHVFSSAEGLSDGFVRAIYRSSNGVLWVGTDDGLFREAGDRFVRIDTGGAFPGMAVHSIAEDSLHRVWVGGSTLISIDAQGNRTQYALPGSYSNTRVKKILQTADGAIWVGTVGGLARLGPQGFKLVGDLRGTVRSLLEAPDATLWVGTIGEGLWRFHEGHLLRMTHPALLPSETVLTLMQDDSAQVWVGTQSGLVRLDATPVSLTTLPKAGDPDFETIAGDTDNTVWVAAQTLYKIHNGVAEKVRLPGLSGVSIRNVYRARGGALWVGTDGSGAYRISGNDVRHYSAPEQLTNNFIRAFMEASDGVMWIATDEGVSAIGPGLVRRYPRSSGLAYFSTRCMLQDRHGVIWIGTDRGLSAWRDGAFLSNSATAALAREKIWSLLEDHSGVLWFGTRDHGLFRLRDGIVEQITAADGLPTNSIYHLLQDRAGFIWMTGPNTIASVDAAQMDSPLPTPAHPLKPVLYSMPFGADNAQMYGGREPAGYLADDDTVWFPTTSGVAHISKAATPLRGPSPRVMLLGASEDGRPANLADNLSIPAGVTRLSFEYTATDLRPRNDLRFRYRLEPLDRDWLSASDGDVATYTNLKAGRYRFRVQAFEASDIARASEANISFAKRPHLYQTWWFYVASAAFVLTGAWAGYRLRLRRIRSRFAAVLDERNRMAREIHDTVIQGCTGLSAVLEAMAITNDSGQSNRDLLDYARGQTQVTINEARRAVWDMRHEREDELSMTEALDGLAAQIVTEHAALHVRVQGLPTVKLRRSALHEVLMVVREATNNAVNHSGSASIELSVEALADAVVVSVRDFGRGMEPATLNTPPPGHFGVVGMRERMKRLGGELHTTTRPGEGTCVEVRVPRSHSRKLVFRGGRQTPE